MIGEANYMMVKESKIEERLARYIEIMPIPVVILDDKFNLVDYNRFFEERYGQYINDVEYIRKLKDKTGVVIGTIMGEDRVYNILYFPREVVRIRTMDELLFQISEYIETLKIVGALAPSLQYERLLSLFPKAQHSVSLSYPSEKTNYKTAVISISNFIERSLIEGYLRKLGFKPLIKWGNENLFDLLKITDDVTLVVLSDESEIPLVPKKIPVIFLSDFGKIVHLQSKYPYIKIVERPVSFENFKLAVGDLAENKG